MEIRIIARGALSGAVAGILGFVFARIFAEPVINQAIAYERYLDGPRPRRTAGHARAPVTGSAGDGEDEPVTAGSGQP